MNELKALRTFVKAAETRNFARVSRELETTPASVTRTIAGLEKDLGVQLFVRTTRQVSLTSEGAVLAARISPILDELAALRREVTETHKPDSGRLRVNVPMSFGQKVLPPLLNCFSERYPDISIEVSLTDTLLDLVEEDFDLALRISEPPSDKFTIWRKICPVERVLVAAPNSPAAAITRPQDLSAEQCLAFNADSREETWDLTDGSARASLIAGRRISANNGDVLANLAAEGSGVALLPGFIVNPMIRAGRLVQILPDWRPRPLWLTLYYPPYRTALPPRIATFSDYFETHVPDILAAQNTLA